MNENTLVRRKKGKRSFQMFALGALIMVILDFALYQTEPFSPVVNDLFANIVIISVASLSAWLAGLAARRYEPSDLPRRIWSQLSIGLWVWTVAEVIWAVYNLTFGEVGVTIGDFFWVLAYGIFGSALLVQCRLVFQADNHQAARLALIWAGGTVVLTLIFAWFLMNFTGREWGMALLLSAFYPVGDLVIGLIALRIVRRFRGGALGYPWLGLFAFAFADILYAVLEMSGAYTWSVTNGNLLSTLADVSYVAAYLFVALGCYAQLLLLKHGPIFQFYKHRQGAG